MIAQMIKTKFPKDIVVLIVEVIGCALTALLALLLKTEADFLSGLLWGLGAATFATAILVGIKRLLGRRKLGEQDEREARIKEKAGLFSLMVSACACSLFTIAAFASPLLMHMGTGYVMAGTSGFMLLLFFAASLFFSKRL